MRAVTMRTGALQQMIAKIEAAAGFPIIDRSSTPLPPTDAGRGFVREAHQILQAAWDQMPGGTPRSQ